MPTPHPFTRKDGSVGWRVRYRLDGRLNPTCETFDDAASAQYFCEMVDRVGGRAAREARDAYIFGKKIRLTRDAFEDLMAVKTGVIQSDTIAKYRDMWRIHIEPVFGDYPVDAITRDMVEQWVSCLARTQTVRSARACAKDPDIAPVFLSAKSIKNIHGLLSSILDREFRDGRIVSNPAARVSLPRTGKRAQPVFLTYSEFAVLLGATPEPWQCFVALLAGTGLRLSEATALTVADINLDAPVPIVTVDKARKRDGTVGVPKTDYSYRSVSLPSNLVPLMAEQIKGKSRGDLVFVRPDGRALNGSWVYNTVWRPTVERAGLGARPRLHDLRHSHVSWLIQQGLPLTVIQRRLGHSSIQVTSDIYGHIQPDVWVRAADATAVALSQALPQIEG